MNINHTIVFFIVLLAYVQKSYGVIILVHGSFATFSTWWKPHGQFFQELEKHATLFNQKVVSFSWSGIPQDSHIILGAETLAKTILSYPADEEIILIGHSHGGNVINFATHLLHNSLGEILASTPCTTISSIITQAYNNLLISNNHGSSNQLHDYTATTRQHKDAAVFKTVMGAINRIENHKLTHRIRNKPKNRKKFMIDKIYVLGTPVHTEKYAPQMNVVHNFFNLYSTGDFIQPVLGLYKRQYPLHERLVNLSVTIHNTGNFLRPNQPKHHELHDPIIGRWLLLIPEVLQTKKLGNFENFSFNTHGVISFDTTHFPRYHKNPKKKGLRIF